VHQGFLPRLKNFDWSQSVTIPVDALQKADRLHRVLRLVLWIGSHLLYLIAILLLAIALMAWRWRIRNGNRSLSTQGAAPTSHPQQPIAARPSRWQRVGPIFALLLLAPGIAELLYGAIRLSTIFVLVSEITTWGCGALLIRECVRRWHKGWQSMLLLGLALAVAEEWVMQQTSISPLTGPGQDGYGRVWGVNWVYFLWALGYESVWVVLLPVQLTELLFPERRSHRWVHARGFAIACAVFFTRRLCGVVWLDAKGSDQDFSHGAIQPSSALHLDSSGSYSGTHPSRIRAAVTAAADE
jgi:hypothetical protein